MLGRTRQDAHDPEGTATQPLLGHSDEDLPARNNEDVIFSVGDDDDADESSALSRLDSPIDTPGHVRFREDVQVIGLPLRSTFESREAGE